VKPTFKGDPSPFSPPTQCDEETMYNLRKKTEAGHHQGQNERPVFLLGFDYATS
jgi:hypothetical protein